MNKFNARIQKACATVAVSTCMAVTGLVWGAGGITGTGYSSGEISDFASVILNGIEYFTTNTNIVINGAENRPQSDLRIGMVAQVTGSINSDGITGQANKIEYNADLIGKLDAAPAISATGATFSVYGLAVRTTISTRFDGALSAAGLNANDTLEVSGLYDANTNAIVAKRVERKAAPAPLQLTGNLSSVTASSFVLGNLNVDFSTANLTHFSGGSPTSGMRVRIKAPQQPVGTSVSAATVDSLANPLQDAEGHGADLQGIVSNLTANGTFTLGGALVATNGSTVYANGSAANMMNGAQVVVDGHIASGVLVATEIHFPSSQPTLFTGLVAAKFGDTLTVFSANGVKLRVNAQTTMSDQTGAIKNNFGISNIAIGDRVAVRGYPDATSVVNAYRVERTKPDSAVFFTGRVSGVAAPNLTMLNQLVYTPPGARLQGASGGDMTSSAFYNTVTGHTLEVQGTAVNGVIVASRATIRP